MPLVAVMVFLALSASGIAVNPTVIGRVAGGDYSSVYESQVGLSAMPQIQQQGWAGGQSTASASASAFASASASTTSTIQYHEVISASRQCIECAAYYCDMPAASTDFYISCFIWGPYSFNVRVTDRINFRQTLTNLGMVAVQNPAALTSPEGLAQALRATGWDGPMWIAEIPAQQITVQFHGQAASLIQIPASRSLATMVHEVIDGKDAISIISLDVFEGQLRQDTNGWIPVRQNDFSPVINVVKATKWWQVA